jgi:D-alanyl-D-alanine dipeptidase
MPRKHPFLWFFLLILASLAPDRALADKVPLPQGFVDLVTMIPGVDTDIRYYSTNNFIGERIDGYLAPRCLLTEQAATALTLVQTDLRHFHLALKIYDCYRPQRAVDHFVSWAEDPKDTRMRAHFYPEVEKKELFAKGYIAAKSSHSRGSTVDLTLVGVGPKGEIKDLDMGTGFDLFSPLSWPDAPAIAADSRAHRLLLQTLMMKHGFNPYPQEWWHFTLANEPYPETYFNFPVQ